LHGRLDLLSQDHMFLVGLTSETCVLKLLVDVGRQGLGNLGRSLSDAIARICCGFLVNRGIVVNMLGSFKIRKFVNYILVRVLNCAGIVVRFSSSTFSFSHF
jgi:hypothetical protein